MNEPREGLSQEKAVASFVLAAALSLATFASVYGSSQKGSIERARSAVAMHERLLMESANYLKANQDVLTEIHRRLSLLETSSPAGPSP